MQVKKKPQKLYKYRSYDVYSLRIFTHAEVLYSDPHSFNDPLDCDPTIEIDLDLENLNKLCRAMLMRNKSEQETMHILHEIHYLSTEYGDFRTNQNARTYLIKSLAQKIKCELSDEFGSRGVLSLSKTWRSVLMWSHYANHHRGICIEFDTTDVSHPNLGEVDYSSSRRIKTTDLFSWKINGSEECAMRVFNTYFLTKAGPWKYEKEWRDIAIRRGVKESPFQVSAVYFGINCDESVIHSVVKLLDQDQHVNLYSISPEENNFGLKRLIVNRNELEPLGLRVPSTIQFKDIFWPEDELEPASTVE